MLVVNDCIIKLEEDVIAANCLYPIDFSDQITLFPIWCCLHSAVLGMKPLIHSCTGLPAHLVRLAHTLESGRTSGNYDKAIEDIVVATYEYKQVLTLPDEAAEWQRKSASILRLSRPARDLTPEQEQMILAVDNGDWNTEDRSYSTYKNMIHILYIARLA